ncbi:MAG: acetylxylan esterase, partial [Steroidobacteraceae bacterium]
GVALYRAQLDSVGSHVQGYLAMPARAGRFPALIIYQYAGVYALDPNTVMDRAAQGWLAFDVDSHDLAPDQGTGVPADYASIGDTDRDTSYFLGMYLRDTRAVDYIETSRHWDHRTIVLLGTSMGGQQSLVTAALNPGRVTAVLVNEPSGADSNGALHGRYVGYPWWHTTDPRVLGTARYFDTVNFASRIDAPALVTMGFIDRTVPPAGVWTALNQIPAPKEAIPLVQSDHNNYTPQKQAAWFQRSEEVLASLLVGRPFQPDQSLTRPLGHHPSMGRHP